MRPGYAEASPNYVARPAKLQRSRMRARCPRSDVSTTHFSRKFFAGINTQSNQYLHLSEQGFFALHISVQSNVKTHADAHWTAGVPPASAEAKRKLRAGRPTSTQTSLSVRARCPRSDVSTTQFSRKFFAGKSIQSNQYLDVLEQGFCALRISVQSDVHDLRAANARKKSLLLFSGISNQTNALEKS
jgi:hypothetical protein